jgi:hypothetical protein
MTHKKIEFDLERPIIRDWVITAEEAVEKIAKDIIILHDECREEYWWGDQKRSKFIESILMRIPVYPFVLTERQTGGLQVEHSSARLYSIDFFIGGVMKMTGVSQCLNGAYMDDLPALLQRRILDCKLTFFIIDHDTPDELREDVLYRIATLKW